MLMMCCQRMPFLLAENIKPLTPTLKTGIKKQWALLNLCPRKIKMNVIKTTLIILGVIGLGFGCSKACSTPPTRSYYMIKYDGKWVNCSEANFYTSGAFLSKCSIGSKHHEDILMATNFTKIKVK